MAIIGIGTDIVDVSRIQRLLEKHGDLFTQRILHNNELEVFKQRKSSVNYLAKRFAAKEALSKALGTGIAQGVSFQDIEVVNNHDGQPQLVLHAKTQEIAEKLGMKKSFISLSDEKKYAIAYVIIES